MKNDNQISDDKIFVNRAIEATIRIGLIVLLVTMCFLIIKAFIAPVLWGVIIAVGIYPLYQKLAAALGKREKLAATLLTLLGLTFLTLPAALLMDSTVSGIHTLSKSLEEGTLTVPPPSEKVATWPVIGEPLDDIWRLASSNLEAAMEKLIPHLKTYGPKILGFITGLGFSLIQFFISIIIAGVLLANAKSGKRTVTAIFRRLAGEQGEEFTDLSEATIRSVVQGVLGVAIIQSVLAGIGLVAVDVPAAGLWALMVLFLAVVQLPPLLVLGPVIFYVFSVAEPTSAVIFMIWSVLVSVSDTFLKPLFLGRGVEVPMLVILLGAIGGLMLSGLLGLFVGSVVLSLGYKIFQAWLNNEPEVEQESS